MSKFNRMSKIANNRPRSENRKQTRLAAHSALLESVETCRLMHEFIQAHNVMAVKLQAMWEIILETAHTHPERQIVLVGGESYATPPIGIAQDEFERRVAAVKELTSA